MVVTSSVAFGRLVPRRLTAPGASTCRVSASRSSRLVVCNPASKSRALLQALLAAGLHPRRRQLDAGVTMFDIGDRAHGYYVVEKGKLLVSRRPASGQGSVRFAGVGDALIYDCGGIHAATCLAMERTTVLVFDRTGLERVASVDSYIARLLRELHADELRMILASLGVREAPRDLPGTGQRDVGRRSAAGMPASGIHALGSGPMRTAARHSGLGCTADGALLSA